jgi:hypothetical protein
MRRKPNKKTRTVYQVRLNWDTAVIGFSYPPKPDNDWPIGKVGELDDETVMKIAPGEFALIGKEGVHFGAEAYPACPHPFEFANQGEALSVARQVKGYIEKHER